MTHHVLVVINALGEGGTERSMAELVPFIKPFGFQFSFVTLRSRGEEGVEPALRRDGYPIHRLEGGLRQQVAAYRRLLDREQPDVVHSMLYEANVVARIGSIGRPEPVVTSLVNTSYSPERAATPGMAPAKLRAIQGFDALTSWMFVDAFHSVSNAVARDATRHLGIARQKITVIGRGRRDPRATLPAGAGEAVRAELGVPPDAELVVNVGRHEFQKDHTTLVRAMDRLLPRRPGLWLVVAGREGGESDGLRSVVARSAHSERILLVGHRHDVPAILDAADLFVMTSRYEGMPGALIEAMGVGLAAVATDIEPVREVAVNGRTALLAPTGDDASLADAIEALLDDERTRRRFGVMAREVFLERFRIEISAARLARFYESAVRDR